MSDTGAGADSGFTRVDELSPNVIIYAQAAEDPLGIEVKADFSLRESCESQYVGFHADSFDTAKIKQVMQDIGYWRCRAPSGTYNYENLYQPYSSNVLTFDGDDKKPKLKLECVFRTLPPPENDEDEEVLDGSDPAPVQDGDDEASENVFIQQEIRLTRTGNQIPSSSTVMGVNLWSKVKEQSGTYFNTRIQEDEKRRESSEREECLVLLNDYIKIQNRLEELYHGDGGDAKLLPEITAAGPMTLPGQVEQADTKKDGLGIGYILAIVFGSLVVLVGCYFAFRHFSGKSDKRVTRRNKRRNKSGDSQDKENGDDSDRTEYQAGVSLLASRP